MSKIAANGIRIEYEAFGRESDPLVVLIAGFGEQMGGVEFSADFCRHMAGCGLRVVRFDNRDAGLTTHFREEDAADYTLLDMAKDTAELVEALGAYHAHIVGSSLGGFVARHMALRFPAIVKSLTLVKTGVGAKPGSEAADRFSSTWPDARERLIALTRPARSFDAAVDAYVEAWRAFAGPGFPFDEQRVRECAESVCLRAYDPAGLTRQRRAIVRSPALLEAQEEITCPTVVVHGEADPVYGVDHGAEIARRIPGARLQAIPGMGHDIAPELWPVLVETVLSVVMSADPPLVAAAP